MLIFILFASIIAGIVLIKKSFAKPTSGMSKMEEIEFVYDNDKKCIIGFLIAIIAGTILANL